MRKLKIYLDTSVISHLKQDDVPEKMQDTLTLWSKIKAGEYEVFISDVTLDEIDQCYEPKRTLMLEYLDSIEYTVLNVNEEIYDIAYKFIENNVLTTKSFDDCRHISCALVNECDVIVSWNFKHIVNHRTIKGVKLISAITGYNEVSIYSPTILIEGEES